MFLLQAILYLTCANMSQLAWNEAKYQAHEYITNATRDKDMTINLDYVTAGRVEWKLCESGFQNIKSMSKALKTWGIGISGPRGCAKKYLELGPDFWLDTQFSNSVAMVGTIVKMTLVVWLFHSQCSDWKAVSNLIDCWIWYENQGIVSKAWSKPGVREDMTSRGRKIYD